MLAERLGLSHTVIEAGLDAAAARRITGNADLIITSRYHPIIFGLGSGVPSLGVYGDAYCRIKLQGALAHARLKHWTLTYDAVARGELLTRALQIWSARSEVRTQLESCHEAWRAESRSRWTLIMRALDPSQTIPPAESDTLFGRPMADVAPALASVDEAGRQWSCERLARCDEQPRSRWLENETGMRTAVSRHLSALRSKFRRGR